MKATQINPTNVSISLIYCVFGILSFLVLKIVSRYFFNHKEREIEVEKGKIIKEDIERVNFSKVFLKTYFMKSTLIGSIINDDKKHLLRELFVLSCIGVSCFHINSYILWPSAVGFGFFLTTFVVSEVLIPLMDKNGKKVKIDQSECSSRKNSTSAIDSNSIQIEHTELQLSVSAQRGNLFKENEAKRENKNFTRKEKIHLMFILIMAIITEILFCQSILTLSLSVSNSGVLNLISFGLSVAIDQFAVRIVIGIVAYLSYFILHKAQMVNFFENHIVVSFCYEYLAKEIKAVHSERIIQEMEHKIAYINNPEIHFNASVHEKVSNHEESNFHEISTVMKIVPEFFEEVSEEVYSNIHVAISEVLPVEALFEEPEMEIEEEVSEAIQEVQEEEEKTQEEIVQEEETQVIEQAQEVKREIEEITFVQEIVQVQEISEIPIINEEKQIDNKSETNYFELFERDISMFDDAKANLELKLAPIKKMKKKYTKPHPKFKNDPLLYFPYEEHKLSHKISLHQEFAENSQNETIFSRDISTIDQNFLSTIEIPDCTEISVVKEEPEINLVLQEKNLNIKSFVTNSKPLVLSTSRPEYERKKNTEEKNEKLKIMKKVSPYFVPLSSEIVNPKKTKKIHVSKNNKENANQTNKSFTTLEAANPSRMTQKDTLALTIMNNEHSTINF